VHRTINRILWIVGAVFRLAIKRGQYSKNPVDSVERAVQPVRELSADGSTAGTGTDAIDPDSVLSPKEIQTLLQEAKPGFERTLFETAYLTGRERRTPCTPLDRSRAAKGSSGKMVIRRSLSWARPQARRYVPLLSTEDQSRRRTISISACLSGSSSVGSFSVRSQKTPGLPDARRKSQCRTRRCSRLNSIPPFHARSCGA